MWDDVQKKTSSYRLKKKGVFEEWTRCVRELGGSWPSSGTANGHFEQFLVAVVSFAADMAEGTETRGKKLSIYILLITKAPSQV